MKIQPPTTWEKIFDQCVEIHENDAAWNEVEKLIDSIRQLAEMKIAERVNPVEKFIEEWNLVKGRWSDLLSREFETNHEQWDFSALSPEQAESNHELIKHLEESISEIDRINQQFLEAKAIEKIDLSEALKEQVSKTKELIQKLNDLANTKTVQPPSPDDKGKPEIHKSEDSKEITKKAKFPKIPIESIFLRHPSQKDVLSLIDQGEKKKEVKKPSALLMSANKNEEKDQTLQDKADEKHEHEVSPPVEQSQEEAIKKDSGEIVEDTIEEVHEQDDEKSTDDIQPSEDVVESEEKADEISAGPIGISDLLKNFDHFYENHWVTTKETVEDAPWMRRDHFITRLEKASKDSQSPDRLHHLWMHCRAAECMDVNPLYHSKDIESFAEIWNEPNSLAAGKDRSRGKRIQYEIENGRFQGNALFLCLFLEAIRPSASDQLAGLGMSWMDTVFESRNKKLHKVIEQLLILANTDSNPLDCFRNFLRDGNEPSIEEIMDQLTKKRQELSDFYKQMFNAGGGKIVHTHCRKAWTQFIRKCIDPFKEKICDTWEKDHNDIRKWNVERYRKEADNLLKNYRQIADSRDVLHKDRKKMDRLAQHFADVIQNILKWAMLWENYQRGEREKIHKLPIDDLIALIDGEALSNPEEELSRKLLQCILRESTDQSLKTHVLKFHENDFLSTPRLLSVLPDIENGIEWNFYAPAFHDPLRTSCILMEKDVVLENYDDDNKIQSLFHHLVMQDRNVLASQLLGSFRPSDADKNRIRQKLDILKDRVRKGYQSLKEYLQCMDELALHERGDLDKILSITIKLLDDESKLSSDYLVMTLEWLKRTKQQSERILQHHIILYKKRAEESEEPLRSQVLEAIENKFYSDIYLAFNENKKLDTLDFRRNVRETMWRIDAVNTFSNPQRFLREVSQKRIDQIDKLIDLWMKNPVRQHCANDFYYFISNENKMTYNRRKVVMPDNLRIIKKNWVRIKCDVLLKYIEQIRLNPSFVPQLGQFNEIFITTPPNGDVCKENLGSDLASSVGVEHERKNLTVYLMPGLTINRRTEILNEFRSRSLPGAVIDDTDLCRLIKGFKQQRPHGFLGLLEIIFEQLNLSIVQPYSSQDGQFIKLEMFVGREDQVDKLVNRADYTRIFSGRKLGKSALVKYIELTQNQKRLPSRNILHVFYINIAGRDDEHWICSEILNKLREKFSFSSSPRSNNPDEILDSYLQEFLEKYKKKSILVILDEADTFVEDQLKRYDSHKEKCLSFCMLKRISAAVDDSGLPRIRFVVAGYRVTNTKEGPWANAGDVLYLEPLIPDEAAKFVEGPLARIGIDAREQAMPIAFRCGYQPAVISRFGDCLIRQLSLKRANFKREPYHLTQEDMVQTLNDKLVQEEIKTVVENNFVNNREGRIVYTAMLIAFNKRPPAKGISDLSMEIYEVLQHNSDDMSWFEKSDVSIITSIRSHIRDLIDRNLLIHREENGIEMYYLKFPHHLHILLSGDPERLIHQSIRDQKSRSVDEQSLRSFLPSESIEEIRRYVIEGKHHDDMPIAAFIVGGHWTEAHQKTDGGFLYRLGVMNYEGLGLNEKIGNSLCTTKPIDLKSDPDPQEILSESYVGIYASPTSSIRIIEKRREKLKPPLFVGGIDLLRWGIKREMEEGEFFYFYYGMRRLNRLKLNWWYEKYRYCLFSSPDALDQILFATGGIPFLVRMFDKNFIATPGSDVSAEELKQTIQKNNEEFDNYVTNLKDGSTDIQLSTRELELLFIIGWFLEKNLFECKFFPYTKQPLLSPGLVNT